MFGKDVIKPEKLKDPVIVCRHGEVIELSENEKSVLRLGPKFCDYVNLSEEDFEVEIEQTILKYKWETIDEEGTTGKNCNNGDPSEAAREILFTELYTQEELDEINEDVEDELRMKEAESRSIFNLNTGEINMRKRRTTDLKGNSRVILPKKMRSFDEEAKLEMMRQETRATMRRYMEEKCGQNGKQRSNLTRGEIAGLRSLKKRIKDGEIVILPTDKTGLFTIMTRETYTQCGLEHTKGDTIVGWEDLKRSQKELNGHTSMLIKIFGIGKDWNHTSRVRETMLSESMTTCPLSLLYKDHKGWSSEGSGNGIPPTRPVAGGHLGMNVHISEIVSDLVEPMVDKFVGGRENISTEDLIARVVELNETNRGWSRWSWWEGQTWGKFMGCGTCAGNWGQLFDREDPELCGCNGAQTMGGFTRVTAWWLKTLRRVDWEIEHGWDYHDEERTILSSEVNPEDLQDYQVPMVVMGSDVISLYPNLDISKMGDLVKEAVKSTEIKWEGIDYMEAVRYIALNWTEDQCRSSKIRRVLPWRRSNHGTRPGMRGSGPRGPTRGDTDQWVFPRVVLSDEEKLEIIGTVLGIAVTTMFQHHYYSFGGETYRQEKGGPIGLRGTCGIARLCMQVFDVKWEETLKTLGIVTNLISRYMDDGRSFMPPLKPGWRWEDGNLKFKVRWEREDQELSSQEVTRRGLLGSLNTIEDYLKFTMEVGEDFN